MVNYGCTMGKHLTKMKHFPSSGKDAYHIYFALIVYKDGVVLFLNVYIVEV